MHLGNRYSSLTRIVLQNIRDNKKICANNYSDTAVYFERFCVVCPWTFFENILCQTFVGYKSKFLKKMVFSASQKPTESRTVPIRYISINFDRKFNRKGSHNSLFLTDQTQRIRNILKVLHVCINGDFKLLVILHFIIDDDVKGELLL